MYLRNIFRYANHRLTMYVQRQITRTIEVLKSFDPRYAATMVSRRWSGWIDSMFNQTTNMQAIKLNIYAFRCIKTVADSIAGLPLKLYIGEGANKVEQLKHPVRDLLYRPNPQSIHADLWRSIVWSLYGAGSAYLVQSKFDANRQPIPGVSRLWTLPADKVKVLPHPTELIGGYIVETETGEKLNYNVNDIINFKLFNPEEPYYGLSEMEVAKRVIQIDYKQRSVNLRFLDNDATPGFMLSTDQPYNAAYDKVLKQQWEKDHKGTENVDRMDIAWAGLKPIYKQFSLKEMRYIEGIRLNAREIITVMNVPPVMVGLWEDAKYANADLQKREFYEQTIIPLLMYIEAVFNELVFPRWGYPDLWLQFDLSGLEVLAGDYQKKADYHISLVNSNIEKISIAQAALGLDPDPEMDLYNYQITGSQFAPMIPPAKQLQSFMVRKDMPPDPYLVKREQFAKRHEDKLRQAIAGFFNGQKDRLIKEIKKYLDGALPENPSMLLDFNTENAALAKAMNGTLSQSYLDSIIAAYQEIHGKRYAGSYELKQSDIEDIYSYADPEIVAFLENHALEESVIINGYTREVIRNLLIDAGLQNLTIPEITRAIEDYFDQLPTGRAATIARTEMGYAINPGTHKGYEAAGATHKHWLSAHKSTTRSSHLSAEAQGWIKFDESFIVGSYRMQYPMDKAGGAEEVINCYCFLQADYRPE